MPRFRTRRGKLLPDSVDETTAATAASRLLSATRGGGLFRRWAGFYKSRLSWFLFSRLDRDARREVVILGRRSWFYSAQILNKLIH
jgi:hypothetical protein